MSHGFELEQAAAPAVPDGTALAVLSGWFDSFNKLLLKLSMLAILATSLVLTYSVATRYFFKSPTDWQDEASVFMLVGMTFFCTAWVQSQRGHIGIEALASVLPRRVNVVRLFLVDLLSLAFCAFFAWKAWALCHEAWVDGQTTSSTFAPPLWIPYSMMAAGMTILTLQLLLQVLMHFAGKGKTA
ncbi:TRAP transporter small permease [Massilia solisilvae]|uniref:TRAP transporter small permease protein n=1 Tax=Massilia solisilvae TaxID=1811225 RepID=A0ABT2BMP5_9BURK|nr:TRAP transporter small permease [Massilia solisilvae]